MKLWQKNFEISKEIERFTVGKDRELDIWIAPDDVIGTLAHIKMLASIGLLKAEELSILQKELKAIYNLTISGDFQLREGVEDIHSQIELMLTEKLGEVGKKIHSGRSRNDQVLVDLKLFIRRKLRDIVELIDGLFDELISLSEKHKNILLPGYTHYQAAMPSSFGLWFGAYAESLTDDLQVLLAAFKVVNKNPLGSAAGYGSSFPINRTMTTELLGFEQLNYNVVYAQMGRGKTEKIVAYALSCVASTLGKMAQDICLYNNQNFGFVSFPDELTTGSSIMPHKKNPDVFELIRSKSNKIIALPNEIAMITSNLASGYHRDLQTIKENFLPVFEEIKSILHIAKFMMKKIKVHPNIINDDKYQYIFSVEAVNDLVLNGLSFRDAYKQVSASIEKGKFKPKRKVHHTHEGSIGNLCNKEIISAKNKVLNLFDFKKMDRAIEKLLSIN